MKISKGTIAVILCVSMLLTSIAPSFSLGEDDAIASSSEEIVLSEVIATLSEVDNEGEASENIETNTEPEEDTSDETSTEVSLEMSVETSTETSTEASEETSETSESTVESTTESTTEVLVASESFIVESEKVETATISDIVELDVQTYAPASDSEIEIILIATKSTTSVVDKTDIVMGTTADNIKKSQRKFLPGYISPGFSVDIVDRDSVDNDLFNVFWL